MIRISKPVIIRSKNTSKLSSVIGLLDRAMTFGHDIVSSAPISESVLYGLEKFLIPNLCFADDNMHNIKIIADVVPSPASKGAVGTGLSLGVDSFQAIYENLNTKFSEHNLTHLCLFNAGAFYNGEENFWNMIPKVQHVADEFGLPLIVGNSNIHTIIFGDYQITHTFYSLFCVFALRKLFSVYYYASSYPLYKFSCINNSVIGNDTAKYDLLTFYCLSDKNLLLYSAGSGKKTRIDKTKMIMNKKIVQDNLDVCVQHKETNCGDCLKCRRTMLQLYFLGYLDKFKKVFPVKRFYKNKKNYLEWMEQNKNNSLLEKETAEYYCSIKKEQFLNKIKNMFSKK